MTQKNAAQLFKAVKQDMALKEQLQAANNLSRFRELAEARGYRFTDEELQREISQLSEEELASVMNPGIAPRHHILHR
ncbi:Nif11-like leader peptide family natural product precursor [Phormidium sp. CCY1219]|uniref:Nif11-like leader peptide family natural product precursor n=1 Tax=Phormidium sp. CCY1219 TaxID=2886104 RepID=UPI002D1ECD4E|nr:Nif11-like leader peptide family natural product precursor [Phormidium sp. CCY1219]MEB3827153.1 Nif11-like leader peptide family natural product precursor [Phormidium sp. CCY1219]